MGKKLLDDSSDSDLDFKINDDYAKKYDTWRQKEELQKFKDKYGDLSELSSSSSESEEEVPEIEKDFLKTLSLLKSKDPKIYDKNVTFFQETDTKEKASKVHKSKPLFIKDYERKQLLEGHINPSDEDEKEINEIQINEKEINSAYDNEQQEIKKCFKALLENSDNEDQDEELLKVRQKDKSEREKEEEDYILWLKGIKDNLPDENENEDLKYLHDLWVNPKLDADEKFLKDYILNKKYIDPKNDDIPSYEEITNDIATLSDDERMLEKQEQFEHKFNFRFEEPDPEFIKHYPRTIGDSLRRKDNKRKQKREEYQQRKKQEKEQKMEEIKRIKALKRKEIEDRINKLKEVTGNDDYNFEEFNIDDDFDPEEHDRKMRELFDEKYYEAGKDEVQKPVFSDDEEIENWDNWVGEEEEGNMNESGNELQNTNSGPHCEDPDFNMDADYDPKSEYMKEVIESTKSKKKKKKKSKFAEAVSKKKPVFDPSSKSFEQYFDDYYKLDCEDIIGDLPTRFKYRQVVPNDFGLSVEEILSAKDSELNQWCSVKKTCQYRTEAEEYYDIQAFQRKAQNPFKKKKVLLSLWENSDEHVTETSNSNPEKKRKRKSKKKCAYSNEANNNSSEKEIASVVDTTVEPRSKKIKLKKDEGFEVETQTNVERGEKCHYDKLPGEQIQNTIETTNSDSVKKHKRELKRKRPNTDATNNDTNSNSEVKTLIATDKPNSKILKSKKKKSFEAEAKTDVQKKRNLYGSFDENSNELGQNEAEAFNPDPMKKHKRKSEVKGANACETKNNNYDAEIKNVMSVASEPSFNKIKLISDKNFLENDASIKHSSHFSKNRNGTANYNKVAQEALLKLRKHNKKKRKKMPSHLHAISSNNKTQPSFHFGDKRMEIGDERLKAYGINPKKFKNRLKYSSKLNK